MEANVRSFILLLILACAVGLLVRRTRVPYTVALVLSGLALSIAGALYVGKGAVILPPELIFYVLLPPLLFEAAFGLHLDHLRRSAWTVGLLATVGVGATAILVGLPLGLLTHLPVESAILFGVIVSATDPVSVVALFREMHLSPRLTLILEAESLFNDGTAVVLFMVFIAATGLGGASSHRGIAWPIAIVMFLQQVVGGALVGYGIARFLAFVTKRIDDRLIELTLTTILAYGSYLVADALHSSGVIAVVTAGIVFGVYGLHRGMSEITRIAVHDFWEYAAFIANSVIFLLIGAQAGLAYRSVSWGLVALAVVVVLIARAIVVYPLTALTSRAHTPIPWSWRHTLVWGGLRGSIAMALVLGLPRTMPFRNEILVMTFAIVIFTLVGQGLTMRPLLRALGLSPTDDETRTED